MCFVLVMGVCVCVFMYVFFLSFFLSFPRSWAGAWHFCVATGDLSSLSTIES